ncbi:hypothetical protein [Simkania sp.]|uniref:hypothetical protein n=1 Tax=Simkania sp. TaxID=34094 RepID=UPI003B52D7FD
MSKLPPVNSTIFSPEVPEFLERGESLFGEVRESEPQIPPQILGSTPVLNDAVNALFSDGNIFDKYAQAHGLKYHIMVTVDVAVEDGRVKTADLEKFGLNYEGETVSKDVLIKDLIIPRKQETEADWKILSTEQSYPCILVRLAPNVLIRKSI